MRDNVRAFVRIAADVFELAGPVYEFGSYLVEGQGGAGDLRGLFPGRPYVGCDLRPGPGVDRVEDLARLTLADGTAPTVICVDTLEHVFEARRAAGEMIRVLAPGGVLLVAAPMDFHIHDYPSDYWRLTPSCLERLLAPLEATLVGWQGFEKFPHTVFGIGFKAPLGAHAGQGAGRFMSALARWLGDTAAAVPWRRKLTQSLAGWAGSKGDRRRQREYYRIRFSWYWPLESDGKQHDTDHLTCGARSGHRSGRSDL